MKIINNTIDNAILQGQGSAQKWISNLSPHQIHYKLDNEFEIIFILGYQKTLNISYADKFLDEIHKRFRDQYKNDLTTGGFNRSFPFRLSYEEILLKMEETKPTHSVPRTYHQSAKKQRRERLVTTKIKTSSQPNPLSYPENSEITNQTSVIRSITAPRPDQGYLQTIPIQSSSNNSFWSKLKKMNVFASNDLHAGIEAMREHLIAKNVGADVAEKICESVSTKLSGKTLGTFESLTTNICQAMRETLMMMLTPKRHIDILRDIANAQQVRSPYVITFCGVNGVGKSTNLAKVAYWLSGNNFHILIAGCDTFRAGAIEQLRTHVCNLNNIFKEKPMIELFERGYGKDPAGIAMQAIHYAKTKKIDVVLIDTAGRMENDKPLMNALAKFIHTNNPDLVLFVGEALVGNRAVDQVIQFNQALIDNSPLQSNPRTIDGILLTKFDTVDDKIGAAISMTYTIDKPIVFVGTGQQCQDLKTINAEVLTEILLK